MEYHRIPSSWSGAQWNTAAICAGCGAIVVDGEAHNQFHADIAEAIDRLADLHPQA